MEESAVKLVRMTTGEDILAEVTYVETEHESYYVLGHPMKVVYLSGVRPGILSVSLMQWVFGRICDNQQFTISPKDVIFVSSASSSMEEYYWNTVDYFEKMTEKLQSDTPLDSGAGESALESIIVDSENQNDLIKSLMEMLKKDSKRTIH